MPKIRIVIDTSALRNDSRLSSGPMEALARFAEQGHVEVLIPHVVAEEFTTLPSTKIETMAELRKTLKNLRQTAPSDVHKDIEDFESRIGEAFERLESAAKQRFEHWVLRTGDKTVYAGRDDADKVLKKYFAGVPPFKRVKARDDFPDAFIVETIFDLAEHGSILVISGDKGLTAALETSPTSQPSGISKICLNRSCGSGEFRRAGNHICRRFIRR